MKNEQPTDLWAYEREAFADGVKLVCGVDEAGRGPLAGPVCAAAVILPPELVIPGLTDSKKLTDKQRRELYDVISAEGLPVRTIVKGDSLSASIAAASILAKVTRDRLMEQYDEAYPQYGFAIHKGYGTKRHYEALREFGPSPIHRMTFPKKFYEN